MKISIIIPVYNVERYILRCLESVASQQFSCEVECILVNDCTPDGSMDIAGRFLSDYHGKIDFRVISHEKNKGLSGARNTGIDASRGDYLLFVDSDDELLYGALSELSGLADKYRGVDVVQGNVKLGDETFRPLDICPYGFPEFTSDLEWIRKHYVSDVPATSWNKLFRKGFLDENGLRFCEGILHEDEMLRYQAFTKVRSIAFTEKLTYFYRDNPAGIMKNVRKDSSAMSMLTVFAVYLPQVLDAEQYKYVLRYLYERYCNPEGFENHQAYRDGFMSFCRQALSLGTLPGWMRRSFRYSMDPSSAKVWFARMFHRKAYSLIKRLRRMER